MASKQAFVSKISESWTHADDSRDQLGDIRWQGGKCYKCVQFNNGAGDIASAANKMAEYYGPGADNVSPNGYASNIVTLDSSDGTKLAAGVFQGVVVDGDRCWVQIKGAAVMADAMIAGSDGDPLTLAGATADTGDLDVSAAVTDHVCAYADDISAKTVVLDCPF